MQDDAKFSLSNLFAATKSPSSSSLASSATSLEPHPSRREHINPLNALFPASLQQTRSSGNDGGISTGSEKGSLRGFEVEVKGGAILPVHPSVVSGVLENGLSYVFLPNKSPAGRFEAHLQVFSGSGESSRTWWADRGELS